MSGHGQTSKADKDNSVSDESFLIRGSKTNQSKNEKGTKNYFIRFFKKGLVLKSKENLKISRSRRLRRVSSSKLFWKNESQ